MAGYCCCAWLPASSLWHDQRQSLAADRDNGRVGLESRKHACYAWKTRSKHGYVWSELKQNGPSKPSKVLVSSTMCPSFDVSWRVVRDHMSLRNKVHAR